MFLQLAHTRLAAYETSRALTLECYKITKLVPADEKYALVQQIRRAALSDHLNIAEGSSRKSKSERARYFEIARGSVVEIDSALDIACDLSYTNMVQLQPLGTKILDTFKLLTGLIAKSSS